MPLYFFHVKHFERVDEDLEGISFETVEDTKDCGKRLPPI